MSTMTPMTQEQHERSPLCWPVDAWGAAACIALTLLAYFLGASPMQKRHALIRQQRQELSEQSARANDLAGQVRQLNARRAALRSELDACQLRLQPLQNLNQRLAQVTAAAGECALDVNDIRPGRAIGGARHTLVPIDLAGAGSYRDCVAFLRKFRDTFADSGIASFQLSRNPADPNAPTSFYFQLIWYVEPVGVAGSTASGR